ncbi:MAG: GNVR domain-containing protein [Candidatus Omnitrophica bacterium]|nr:GNVR domain-containing protein [Candidatus Omnitrophota bacterium]
MEQLQELNIQDYVEILLKRKWTAAAIFITVIALAVTVTGLQTSLYKAQVVFKVVPASELSAEQLFAKPVMVASQGVEDEIANYAKQILSKIIVGNSLEQLGLMGKTLSPAKKDEIITETLKHIKAGNILKTNMISLEVTSPNAQLSADLANKIFLNFKQVNFDEKNKQRRGSADFLRDNVEQLSKKLETEEARLSFLNGQGIAGTAEGLLKQIDDLEMKRINLLSVFTENYPDVMALSEEIAELRAELKTLPKEEYEFATLKRNMAVDQKLYDSLREKLQEAQIKEAEKVDNIVLVDSALPPQNRCFPSKKINYALGVLIGGFLAVVGVTFIEQVVETSIGRVEDIEAFVKVGVVGVIPYFAAAMPKGEKSETGWKHLFKRRKEDETASLKSQLIALHSGGSLFVEAFRILGTNVQVILGQGGRIRGKSLMITSSNPDEGKSMINSNLAITLAQMGYKTLLIDCDLRRPNIHKLFGFEEKSKGFTDLLLSDKNVEDMEVAVTKTATDLLLSGMGADNVIDRPWINNLHILTAGSVFPNPVHLLNSDKVNEVLAYLKKKYDVIIIDSAPIFAVSDTTVMLPKVDTVLLVYRVGTTSRLTLRRAKAQIESVKGKDTLAGLILNNVMPELSKDSYYYYHKDYHETFDRRKGEKAKEQEHV